MLYVLHYIKDDVIRKVYVTDNMKDARAAARGMRLVDPDCKITCGKWSERSHEPIGDGFEL